MSKHNSIENLVSATEVAKIWNKRAQAAGFPGKYTRWSVYQRREKLGGIETPLGYLYDQKRAEEINLRFGSPSRPDTAERNRKRKQKNEFSDDMKTDV